MKKVRTGSPGHGAGATLHLVIYLVILLAKNILISIVLLY